MLRYSPPTARSWWLLDAMATDGPDAPTLEGRERADVCIVGGGYTGLWTALRLLEHEPALDIAILEADVCGGGASGRNGGFALTFWHHILSLKAVCGDEEALRLAQASEEAVAEIGAFCSENGVDAGYRADGWLWTATNAAQVDAWSATVAAAERLGATPYVALSSDEVAARTGSRAHIAGAFERTAASLHPARLARGLRRVALERGVRIFERSPAVELKRSAKPCVRTTRGHIDADRVVVATNAWSVQLPEVRRALAVIGSDVVITAPAPDLLDRLGLADGVCISDSRLMVSYYRRTPEGRLAFGRGGGTLAYGGRIGHALQGASQHGDWVEATMRRAYPPLRDVPVTHSWTGPIDRAHDGLPFFAPLGRPDIVLGAGYSGNGVGPSVLGGRILASLALELDDEWAGCGLVRAPGRAFPPEPVRYAGGRLVRAAVARKEAAEDRGKPSRKLARAVAGLAPAGLVPTE